jgi:flagellar biosynthesis protein FlhB
LSDKTEAATPKRLRKAQEGGDSPLSTFASQSLAFLAAVFVAPLAIGALGAEATAGLRAAIARAADPSPPIAFDPAQLGTAIVGLAAPILLTVAITAGIASFVQTGGVIATKRLAPDLARLDPISGMKQLLSPPRLIAVARAGLFAAAVAWVTLDALRTNAAALARSTGQIGAASQLAIAISGGVAKKAAIVGLFLAILDVVVTRRSWQKRLMMSKAEVKREHKESEGDPQLKSARERAHHEMLAAVAIRNVKDASVVVVNPTHIACALKYDEYAGDDAPVLVASGHGELARRMIEAAHQYGVPVLRDVPLARALAPLEVGAEIPEALYEAVAEILRAAWDDAGAPGSPAVGSQDE